MDQESLNDIQLVNDLAGAQPGQQAALWRIEETTRDLGVEVNAALAAVQAPFVETSVAVAPEGGFWQAFVAAGEQAAAQTSWRDMVEAAQEVRAVEQGTRELVHLGIVGTETVKAMLLEMHYAMEEVAVRSQQSRGGTGFSFRDLVAGHRPKGALLAQHELEEEGSQFQDFILAAPPGDFARSAA